MLNGRRMNPNRWFNMGAFGWVANGLTLLWTVFTTIMWLFPGTPSPSAADMSECVEKLH